MTVPKTPPRPMTPGEAMRLAREAIARAKALAKINPWPKPPV